MTSRSAVEFLNTVRVSGFRLCRDDFGHDFDLLGGVVYGFEFTHGSLGEVAAIHGFSFVVLFDQDAPASLSRAGFGKTPTTSVRRLISVLTRSMGSWTRFGASASGKSS